MKMETKIALKPLYDRVLVKPDDQVERTASGIVLPVESRKKSNTGTVIAAGTGTLANSMQVKAGDRVLYQRYAGLDVEWDGIAYSMILCGELIAIIDPDFVNVITYKDQNESI